MSLLLNILVHFTYVRTVWGVFTLLPRRIPSPQRKSFFPLLFLLFWCLGGRAEYNYSFVANLSGSLFTEAYTTLALLLKTVTSCLQYSLTAHKPSVRKFLNQPLPNAWLNSGRPNLVRSGSGGNSFSEHHDCVARSRPEDTVSQYCSQPLALTLFKPPLLLCH